MYLLLLYLPFIGSFLSGLTGRHLGSLGASFIATNCLFISFLLSTILFYETVLSGCITFVEYGFWIHSGTLSINWGFLFDSLTGVMCLIVTFVSFLVHVYSTEYMSHDPHLPRFMSYLSLFTFFMLVLVSANNLVQMFIGWEGVGLCSYLLINFWFTRIQANKAAIKAMIINRIGDFSLLIAIMLIYTVYESLDYNLLTVLTNFSFKNVVFFNYQIDVLFIIGFFIFFGAVGKSAQLGLHTWLPDAMEGPTPVSALIHAATMVTAGVFLLARLSFIFEQLNNLLKIITILGALTSFFAASIGLAQNDLKRVIAYSTCSQLGYMIFACGLSDYSLGIFHLSNHAFFKALLFLSAGSIIHSVADEQDMRKMGALKNLLPLTYCTTVIGSLALAGFPFLSGFYSKDLILELAAGKYNIYGTFAYLLGTISAFFTAFYSIRLLHLTFLSKTNGYKKVILFASDPGLKISFTLIILSVFSIFIGFLSNDMFVSLGSTLFNKTIFLNVYHFTKFSGEFSLPFIVKILPILLSFNGIVVSLIAFSYAHKILFLFKVSKSGIHLYQFLNQKWYFDKLFNEFVGQKFFKAGYSISYKLVDRCVFEMLGPTGISIFIMKISSNLHKLQTSHLSHYNLVILSGFTSFIIFKQLSLIYYFLNVNFFIVVFLTLLYVLNDNE